MKMRRGVANAAEKGNGKKRRNGRKEDVKMKVERRKMEGKPKNKRGKKGKTKMERGGMNGK